MKLYEKMGIDLNTSAGIKGLFKLECQRDMPCHRTCKKFFKNLECQNNIDCRAEMLFSEVPTKKRWETYEGDFKSAYDNYINDNEFEILDRDKYSPLDMAKFAIKCFTRWLMEDVEVDE